MSFRLSSPRSAGGAGARRADGESISAPTHPKIAGNAWLWRGAWWAMLALHVAPVWLLTVLATADGPSHLGMASHIRALLSGSCPALATMLHFTPAPVPNWLGHAVMALSMEWLSPLASEKILQTLIIGGLAGGFYALHRTLQPHIRGGEYLVFPLLYSVLWLMGSYNFLLGLAGWMLLFALWLRWHKGWNPARIAVMALAIIALYFTHIFAVALLALSMATHSACEAAYTRNMRPLWRQGWVALAITAPAGAMFAAYAQLPKLPFYYAPALSEKLAHFLHPPALAYSGLETLPALLSAAAVVFALVYLAITRIACPSPRPWRWGMAMLALSGTALALFGPTHLAGGWLMELRFSMVVWLALSLWIALSLPSPRVGLISAVLASAIAIWLLAAKWPNMKAYSRFAEAIIAAGERLPPAAHSLSVLTRDPLVVPGFHNSMLAPTSWRTPSGWFTAGTCRSEAFPFHVSEINTFPLSLAPAFSPYTAFSQEMQRSAFDYYPPRIDIDAYPHHTGRALDYVLLIGNPAQADTQDPENAAAMQQLLSQLKRGYREIYASENAEIRLYQKTSP